MHFVCDGYDPADERRRESLFGVGNGVLFVRASAVEAEAEDGIHYPGTYHAGLYDRRLAEIEGEELGHDSLVKLPNWLALRFRPEGEDRWFSLGHAEVLEYRQRLDLDSGCSERCLVVRDGLGRRTRMTERLLVSLRRPNLVALSWRMTPEDWSGRIEIRAMLNGDVRNHNTDGGLIGPYRHLTDIRATWQAGRLLLTARTRHSGTPLAVAVRIRSAQAVTKEGIETAEAAGEVLVCDCATGQPVSVEKIAAIATALDPAMAEPSRAACAALADAGDFIDLREENRRGWRRLWRRAHVRADEPELERDLSFHVFHIFQAVSPNTPNQDAGFPSRGWQEAYHGQIFWDELFVFPFLNHRFPEIARGLLSYRYRRMEEARRAARAAGLAGAMFPWRSAATGEEQTPSYQPNPLSGRLSPDHTRLQRHIGAVISYNIWNYYLSTGDCSFLAEYGAEMLVEIARFWASIARRHRDDGRYDIRGVIGPDEYHNAYPGAEKPGLDNNAYTNIMAAIALRTASEALEALSRERRAELADLLSISKEEPEQWRQVASRLRLCFSQDGILEQFAGFSALKPLDIPAFRDAHPEGRIDHVLEATGDSVDAYQVSKQPDILMLLYLMNPEELIAAIRFMGYDADREQVERTARFYLQRMSAESSLSRVVCAGAFSRLDPSLSWSFFRKSLRIDFDPSNSTSAPQGLHLGAMAGTLDVLQKHYLGIRPGRDALVLRPAPPPSLAPVRLRLNWRGREVLVSWDGAVLALRAASDNHLAMELEHAGERITLEAGTSFSVRMPCPAARE